MSGGVLLWVAGRDVLNGSINSWIDGAGFGLFVATKLICEKKTVLTAFEMEGFGKAEEWIEKKRSSGGLLCPLTGLFLWGYTPSL